MRIIGDGKLQISGARHRLSLGYGGGAKLFFTEQARSADEALHRAHARWSFRADQTVRASLFASFYDAYQRVSTRDFRTGGGGFGLSASRSRTSATLHLGYQGLQFKPFSDYSFHSIVGGVGLSQSLPIDEMASWRLGFTYAVALRGYLGPVLGDQRRDPCEELPGSPTCGYSRRDVAQTLTATADYFGDAIARFWYEAEINQSNSFGESFLRHTVGIKFTAPLFWGIYLTTKGVLRFSQFDDPFLVTPLQTRFVDIDDENRSTLMIRLSRDLTKHCTLGVRYSLYVNESGRSDSGVGSPSFQRHLLFVGARFRLGTD
jgi:hypothetical protein